MRIITPTLSICALAAAFTAGALTAGPARSDSGTAAPAAAHEEHSDPAIAATDPAAAPVAVPAVVPADAEPVITVSGFAFDVPAVAPGDTVRIVNLDSAPHTVTANDGTFGIFVDAGGEATFTAPAAGSYAFFCEIHPSMTGTLAVG